MKPKRPAVAAPKSTVSRRRQKVASSRTEKSDKSRDAIEHSIATLIRLLTTRLSSLMPGPKVQTRISCLRDALGSHSDERKWIEAARIEVVRFCKVAGFKGFRTSHGNIPMADTPEAETVEYLVAMPVWDTRVLDRLGISDAFHIAIYWDTLTWPKFRVISAGLDEDEEGLRRAGGRQVFH